MILIQNARYILRVNDFNTERPLHFNTERPLHFNTERPLHFKG